MEHKDLKTPLTMKQMEKHIKVCANSKGVRYDVFIEDNLNRIYDAEMQNLTTVTKEELPLRSRFYQGMIDLVSLESGMDYINLKESYVIFICTSDPFDRNLGCYSITNTCQEDISLPYNDKRTILYYNTKGSITIDVAAKKAEMSVEEFEKLINA